MILYVVITSLVNLALGYALATYVRRSHPTNDSAVRLRGAAGPPAKRSAALHAPTADAAWTFDGAAATVAAGATETMDGDHQGAAEHSHPRDRLAGIEDFRNQLAQLKNLGATPRQPMASGSSL